MKTLQPILIFINLMKILFYFVCFLFLFFFFWLFFFFLICIQTHTFTSLVTKLIVLFIHLLIPYKVQRGRLSFLCGTTKIAQGSNMVQPLAFEAKIVPTDCILIYLETMILCIFNFLILYGCLFGVFFFSYLYSDPYQLKILGPSLLKIVG